MKILAKILLLLAFIAAGINITYAQTTREEKKAAKAAGIKSIVEAQNYIFKATFVIPMRGGSKSLTSDYDLVVARDTIISYLPYFGQSHVAPIGDAAEGGIKFTTTQFTYVSKTAKNGSWAITIKPQARNIGSWRDVRSMTLNIYTDGTATLSVTSTNRDPISFNGYVEARGKSNPAVN